MILPLITCYEIIKTHSMEMETNIHHSVSLEMLELRTVKICNSSYKHEASKGAYPMSK